MGKQILCLDFDGVIHSYVSGWTGARNIPDDPMPGALEFIHESLIAGWDVVIHSSRARHFGGISAMKTWLYRHAMADNRWYEVMGTPGIEDARFCRWKPSATLTIDDRALQFRGEWPSNDAMRQFKPWKLTPTRPA